MRRRVSDRRPEPGVDNMAATPDAAQGDCLEPGEFIEDLQCDGLKIIARRDGFRYGTDSVLLANFVKAKRGDRIVELCSGTGVVSILLSAKTRAASITGVEIQPRLVGMANRSAAMNNISDRVSFYTGDIRDARDIVGLRERPVDVVVVNPPYLCNDNSNAVFEHGDSAAIARHEITCTLADVVAAAKRLLNPGGLFYIVYRSDRLVDLFHEMRAAGIEPKELHIFDSHNEPQKPAIVSSPNPASGTPPIPAAVSSPILTTDSPPIPAAVSSPILTTDSPPNPASGETLKPASGAPAPILTTDSPSIHDFGPPSHTGSRILPAQPPFVLVRGKKGASPGLLFV